MWWNTFIILFSFVTLQVTIAQGWNPGWKIDSFKEHFNPAPSTQDLSTINKLIDWANCTYKLD